MNSIKVAEIFEGIQGEGEFLGTPMLFIRVSGCTRSCSFCDTKYHTSGKGMAISELVNIIGKFKGDGETAYVCFTGGEPLLVREQIYTIISAADTSFDTSYEFHIETNGDLLDFKTLVNGYFNHFSISPKDKKTAIKVKKLFDRFHLVRSMDIKVVTDLNTTGVDLLPYATSLMPLTTYNEKKDKEIRQKVWQYCLEHNLRYTPRAHYEVWGRKRAI